MQVIRIELPVLAESDTPEVLGRVISIEGVLAAGVEGATIEILATHTGFAEDLRAEFNDALHEGSVVPV